MWLRISSVMIPFPNEEANFSVTPLISLQFTLYVKYNCMDKIKWDLGGCEYKIGKYVLKVQKGDLAMKEDQCMGSLHHQP